MALTQISTQGIKDGTITGSDLATNVDLVDNQKLRLGTGNDLEIYHNGTHSFIQDTGTGNLMLAASAFQVTNAAVSETMIYAVPDGAVNLYYDNSKKFETISSGVQVSGTLFIPDGGQSSNRISMGNSGDLQIYHDGSNSYIKQVSGATGDLLIFADGHDLEFITASGGHSAIMRAGGAVELYFNNSLRLSTTANGVTLGHNLLLDNATNAGRDVTWDPANDQLQWKDNTKASFGDSSDLKIYSDGTNGILEGGGSGANAPLFLNFNTIRLQTQSGGEKYIDCQENGAVELYYNNSKQFETTADGVNVQGHITLAASNNAPKITFDENGADDPKAEIQMDQTDGSNASLIFKTEGSGTLAERMRINSDGDVFVATTVTNPGFGNNSDPGHYLNHVGYAMHSRNNGTALFVARNDNTGSLVSFNYNGGGQIADITTNGSSVSYNTGSDYRLKENIINLTNAITRLKNLKPSRFNFLTTPSITQDGFIAHEVQEVVPEAVTGVKDEVRTEDGDMGEKTGDPVMQSLDVSKLVPLLTAALQELVTKVEVLEAEVASLKAS